jgi:hypothetical protein
MPTPQATLDLERVLRSLEGHVPAAVVILVSPNGELETASMGIDNDKALFDVVFSVSQQLAQEIFEELPESRQRVARAAGLILPRGKS